LRAIHVRQGLGIACIAIVIGGASAAISVSLTFRGEDAVPSAVIIDQLATTDPNPAFVAEATQHLERAGYAVDYVDGQDVSVRLFETLPDRGYDVIVIRSHVGQRERRPVDALVGDGEEQSAMRAVWSHDIASFFTNEEYTQDRHVRAQQVRSLGVVYYPPPNGDGRQYFGILPEFISYSSGSYDGALIMIMGCGGPGSPLMAQAFLDKGAEAVVSWDGLVTAEHTDRATAYLLDRLYDERAPIRDGVAATGSTIGRDPIFGAALQLFRD
jgi:hypothetical protein